MKFINDKGENTRLIANNVIPILSNIIKSLQSFWCQKSPHYNSRTSIIFLKKINQVLQAQVSEQEDA